jgi:hypothetical protein
MRKIDIFKNGKHKILMFTIHDLDAFEYLFNYKFDDKTKIELEEYIPKDYLNCVLVYKKDNEYFFKKTSLTHVWDSFEPIIPMKFFYFDAGYVLKDCVDLYLYFKYLNEIFTSNFYHYFSLLEDEYLKKLEKYPYHFKGKTFYFKIKKIATSYPEFIRIQIFDENKNLIKNEKIELPDGLKYVHDLKMYLNDKIHKILFTLS